MLIGVALLVTWLHVLRRGAGDERAGFGMLSLDHVLPAGRARCSIAAQNTEAKRNARWIALYTTLFTFGASLYLWAQLRRRPTRGFQFVEEMDWLGGSINYKMGVDGISHAVRGADRLPDAAVHPGELGVRSRRASRST